MTPVWPTKIIIANATASENYADVLERSLTEVSVVTHLLTGPVNLTVGCTWRLALNDKHRVKESVTCFFFYPCKLLSLFDSPYGETVWSIVRHATKTPGQKWHYSRYHKLKQLYLAHNIHSHHYCKKSTVH